MRHISHFKRKIPKSFDVLSEASCITLDNQLRKKISWAARADLESGAAVRIPRSSRGGTDLKRSTKTMRRGGVLAALAVCACACVFGASATAVATQQDVNPFGFWQKTLGTGKFLEEIMEAKETLTKQLEATKHTMEGERFRPPGGRTRRLRLPLTSPLHLPSPSRRAGDGPDARDARKD